MKESIIKPVVIFEVVLFHAKNILNLPKDKAALVLARRSVPQLCRGSKVDIGMMTKAIKPGQYAHSLVTDADFILNGDGREAKKHAQSFALGLIRISPDFRTF